MLSAVARFPIMARIKSFDNTEEIESQLLRPDRFRHLFADLSKPNVIARGSGLSYCNASAIAGGRSVLSALFNRFISFDHELRLIRVESGLTMGELFDFAVVRGLMPPVLPGYPKITVGGAIAMNVHGKNQHRAGNFGDHIRRLSLFHPQHGILNCTREENSELFHLTIGGFGLTGFLLSADIILEPLRGKSMVIYRHRVGDLVEAAELMDSMVDQSDYLYSWHDLNRKGSKFGGGTVYLEQFSNDQLPPSTGKSSSSAIRPLPWPLLNRLTVPLVCQAYAFSERQASKREITNLYSASFPMVGKEIYFRLFGQRGFREYQVVFPKECWKKAVEQVAAAIKVSGTPISLASLKLFRGERRLLNFSGDGICLALDTPNTADSIAFFSRLDDIAINLGGIGNVAKDSRLNAATVRAMYGGYADFSKALRAYDPDAYFQSELRRRLDV